MPPAHHYETPPEDRVPFLEKTSWGIAGFADTMMTNGINYLVQLIYVVEMGIDPIWIGYAIALPRFFDAITDPIIGNFSDNFRSRWGRRRPLIAIGALMSALTFALVWMPPLGWGKNFIFYYFLVMSLLYYLGYTIFAIPNNALGFEMSRDYHERTRIQAFKAFFGGVGGFLLPWLYKLSQNELFGGDPVQGVRYVACGTGVLILITALMPAIFCREKVEIESQPKINLYHAFALTLQNKVFLLLSVAVFLVLLGLNLVGPFSTHINLSHVTQGDKDLLATLTGWGGTLYAALSIASLWPITWISTRIGKKKTLIGGLLMATVSSLMSWFLYTPQYPYLHLVCLALSAPGLGACWLLGASMLADICDIDDLHSGLRREGMFGAVYAFIFKAGMALVTILAGYMLSASGFNEELTIQTPETVTLMRVYFAIIPALTIGTAIVCMIYYPITEEKAYEVREALKKRQALHEQFEEESPEA